MINEIELLLEGLEGSISEIVEGISCLPATQQTKQAINNIKSAVANALDASDGLYCLCERLPDFEGMEKQNELLLMLLSNHLNHEQKISVRINFGIEIN
jgi:hypothetical protein